MPTYALSRIAMACFVEGIDPASLALSPGHLAYVEGVIAEIGGDCGTDGYYRALESLSVEPSEEIR
jgi:hypothetical protein